MDERVTAAISNWAPRFIANGVDQADFARVTGRSPAGTDGARPGAPPAPSTRNSAGTRPADGRGRPPAATSPRLPSTTTSRSSCSSRTRRSCAGARRGRALPERRPAAPEPARRAGRDPVRRRRAGRRSCAVPAGPGPHPVVVLIPGLDSAKEEFRATEQLFLDRGLATFSVDGPGQGEAEYDLAIRPDWEVPGAAILDAVSAMPGIDPGRIGHLGRQPRRLLRPPAGHRRPPGPGLHRAVPGPTTSASPGTRFPS